MQRIVTVDGFGVHVDPGDHFGTLTKILAGQLIVKVLQPFEIVRGLQGPSISILGLIKFHFMNESLCKTLWSLTKNRTAWCLNPSTHFYSLPMNWLPVPEIYCNSLLLWTWEPWDVRQFRHNSATIQAQFRRWQYAILSLAGSQNQNPLDYFF